MNDIAAPRRPLILVVDDTPTNIHVLIDVLGQDYEFAVATDGPQALTLAARDRPDLILLDVMMPAMDGYQVCRRLKEDPTTHGIPVIFVTARDDTASEALGLDLGAVDYIAKPFALPIVRARVRTHIDLKRRTDQLEALAMIDGLTGIANRRRFDQSLEAEWQRAHRHGRALSLAMIDIDHFKAYNDRYGHGAGDDCLRRVAQVLERSRARPADLAARYGGEELALLLPETDAEGADRVARRFRDLLAELALAHADSPVAAHVTASIGCATLTASPDADPRALIEAADAALYRAKREGRNRVCRG